jgi:hypothetical protein
VKGKNEEDVPMMRTMKKRKKNLNCFYTVGAGGLSRLRSSGPLPNNPARAISNKSCDSHRIDFSSWKSIFGYKGLYNILNIYMFTFVVNHSFFSVLYLPFFFDDKVYTANWDAYYQKCTIYDINDCN